MEITKRVCWSLAVVLSLLSASAMNTLAAGPLVVVNGEPVKWSVQTISYRVDSVRLGSLSNPQALNLVDNAFRTWENVPGAAIRFTRTPQPLSGSERTTVINRLISGQSTGMNPIIFDEDGTLIDSIFGSGARNNIIGFAGPFYSGNRIIEARAVFNSLYFRNRNTSQDEIFSTILHEFGHMCGLDHAQHSRHLANNGVVGDEAFIPIMFPVKSDDDAKRTELTFDDRISLSNMYPTFQFPINTGRIAGRVQRGNSEMPGVNVIARDVSNPIERISSTVTGTFDRNRGTFELAGLPDGEYELMVEALDSRFHSASSVGQYANNSNDVSFWNPVRPQFYSQEGGRSAVTTVRVRAGQTERNIDINVDAQALTNDERNTVILPINSTVMGGAAGSRVYRDAFLLIPNGDEERIVVRFDFNQRIRFLIEAARETSPGQRSVGRFEATDTEYTLTLGEGGDIPLRATRYFFSITNMSSAETLYEISVTETKAPTPTPRFTPTPMPTPTPTVTPAPTPIPTPTPTPTPLPIMQFVDINQDGRIDALDLFAFAQDWEREPAERLFDTRETLGDGPLGKTHLVEWLSNYQVARWQELSEAP